MFYLKCILGSENILRGFHDLAQIVILSRHASTVEQILCMG